MRKMLALILAPLLSHATVVMAAHIHEIADVTGLSDALSAKADVAHEHVIGNMTIVATSGGEYADPVSAVSDLANWCGAPSPSNPCLVKIMPGVYSITSPIALPAHVDLVGSGAGSTTIIAGNFNAIEGDSAGVTISDMSIYSGRSAIRLLSASTPDGATIKNIVATSQVSGAIVVYNNDATISIDNCKVTASDGPISVRGTTGSRTLVATISRTELLTNNPSYLPEAGIGASNARSLILEDMKIINYLENFQIGSIDEVKVNRLDGVAYFNFPVGIDVTVRDSRLSNPRGGVVPIVWGPPSYGPIKVANTMLVGGTDATAAEATLLNCFDENLQPISASP